MSLLLLLRQDDGSVFVTVALVIVTLHLLVKLLSDHLRRASLKSLFLANYSFAPNVIFPSARNGGAKTRARVISLCKMRTI